MSFATGDIVGGCEILARLKAGGMATLYLARREGVSGFSRRVAIKVVHDHLAEDEEFVRMFVDEALLSSRISHPNVVHVEELGREDDQHFLVMEYVHGCSLSQLLKELARRDRALPYELSVSIAMQVLAGLHAAHEVRDDSGRPAGVVHRDVSPDNVLLSYDGHVKLIDFGIAKAQDRATQTSGQLKGKLRYMSPEQARGGHVDRRTDLYALAVVLWEMLTMRRLFNADDQFQLLELVRNPDVPKPTSIRADVPPEVEALVMSALAPDAEDRLPTALEMRRKLARASPGALLADASKLAELLSVAMRDQRARAEARLSASEGTAAPEPPPIEEEALMTMTISMTGVEFLHAGDPSRSSTAQVRPPKVVPSPEAPAAAKSARPAWMLAVVAVIVLGVAAGIVVGLSVFPTGGSSDIEATPLPRGEAASEPTAAAPPPVDVDPPAAAEPASPEPEPPEPAAVEPTVVEPVVAEPVVEEPPAVASPRTRRRRAARRGDSPRPPRRGDDDLPLADEF